MKRFLLIIVAISSTTILAHPPHSFGFTKQQIAQGQSGEEQERKHQTLTDEEVKQFLDKFALPERLPSLLELERRGVLPPDMLEALLEAKKRGLLEPYLAALSSSEAKIETGSKPSSTESSGKPLMTAGEVALTAVFVVALVIYILVVFFLIPNQLSKKLGSKRYVSLYWWGLGTTVLALVLLAAGHSGLTGSWSKEVETFEARMIRIIRSGRHYTSTVTKSTPRFELFLVPPVGGLFLVSIVRILELAREKDKTPED